MNPEPFPGMSIDECLDRMEKAEPNDREFYLMLILRWLVERVKAI